MTDKKTVEGAMALFLRIAKDARDLQCLPYPDVRQMQDYFRAWEAEKDAEIAAKDARIAEFESEISLLINKIITGGVAASHPDANLTLAGLYANEWDSAQAEQVRSLRERADKAQARIAELESALAASKVQESEELLAEWVKVRAAQGAGEPVGEVRMRWGEVFILPRAAARKIPLGTKLYAGRPPAPEQAEAPKGFALVPLKPNAEMERLFSEGEWDWCDILAAAESINEAQFDAMRAPEQAEAVRKDAERYRWLRHWHEHVYAVDADGDLILKHHGVGIAGESAERFDAAIDAALAAGEQG